MLMNPTSQRRSDRVPERERERERTKRLSADEKRTEDRASA